MDKNLPSTSAGDRRSLEGAPPQIILLDLTMPAMDGFTFLHELRAKPGYEDTPVVVLTGRLLDAEERRQLEGADRVLTKGETVTGNSPGNSEL